MNLNFIGGSFQGPAKDVNAQTTVNLFVNVDEQEKKKFLLGTPGLETVATLPTKVGRGAITAAMDDKMYVVYGNTLYKVASNMTYTTIGVLQTSSGRVSMADNGLEICLVDGSYGYVYDGTTFTQIADGDFLAATTVTYMDGYFIFSQKNGNTFFISDLYDGSAYDALDRQEAEGWPDKLVSVMADHRELWLFGDQSTEVWYNSGDADFPFSRFQGGFTHQGCAAAFSPARIDNSIMWLQKNERGQGQIVRAAEGYRAKVVSPPQVNWQISQYSRIDDAFSFVYQDEGHEFYQITFPSENVTWVFDASVPLPEAWFLRSTNRGDGLRNRHAANAYTFAYGEHYVLSDRDGKLYRQSSLVYTENDDEIIRERIGARVNDGTDDRISIPAVQLIVEKGEPMTVELRWSKDGGNHWGSFEDREITIGEYLKRLVWRKLGQGRDWLFHARISAEAKVVIKDLVIPDRANS